MSVNGKEYIYVKAETALAQGYACYLSSASAAGFVVTPDLSKVVTLGGVTKAFVALNTIDTGSHGWVQKSGLNSHVKTDGSVAKGENLVFDTDLVTSTMAAGEEYAVFGIALATDSGSILTSCYLNG